MVSLIVAVSSNGVIGREGKLPWHLPDDLKHFKAVTMGKPVIMGRKTWDSIGRALPGRRNLVVTRNSDFSAEGCEIAHSLEEALALTEESAEVVVIGGASLYAEALPRAQRIYLTEVNAHVGGDTRFPRLDRGGWKEVSREAHPADHRHAHAFSFVLLERTSG